MSDQKPELRDTLARLENSTRKVIATRGYTKDAKNLKLLEEMIREQLNNENTHTAARKIR